ncbi:class I adenylate-forming enzyme family protein [Sporosarcina highlanderae]|uniref:AMP-binding protein n=1 Tax=Sporosarcina highlanderae TaxID=3035916 RepID=A0ABT8JL32_9BACL|nr:AMP-binding protein [Sporosarcina highlanderae]MDN4605858.1 AMP-binding protein [Sporosarcina highlanderae]
MLTHGNQTLYTLLKKQAGRYGEKPFVVFEEETISYREMLERVNRTARWLKGNGIQKGDMVAVFLANAPVFYEMWYACGALGAVLLPINTASTPSELEYFLDHSESRGFLYDERLVGEEHLEVARERDLVFMQLTGDSFNKEREEHSADEVKCEADASDVACIMYTSGTTAKPKGVLITHENYMFAGHSSVLYQQLTPDDRYLIFLPLFHANSQYYTSMASLVVGGTIILRERFSSTEFWDVVERYQPTVTSLVATVIKMLLELPENEKEKKHSLKRAGYGLFVPYPELQAFQDRFDIKLYQWYGMTETMTTNIVTPLYEDMIRDRETGIVSIGKPGLGHEVKIIGPDDEEMPFGEVGQILIKSPSLMKGYFKNPEATAQTLRDGWLYTGDSGYMNEEGFIWFVDRSKDLIKRAGENISSIEVENVLSEHPAVQDCAIVGEPDKLREEIVIAYVKLHQGQEVEPEELETFCRKHLSYFKVPQEFRIIEDFPRTSIGKIQKNLLRKS